jgi:hypothetical protein
MAEIILTEEQSRIIAEAKASIEIRDSAGAILIIGSSHRAFQ